MSAPPRRRPDPGPSRMAYRMARLWALSSVRALVQVYLPLSLAALIGWAVVKTDHLRLAIQAEAQALLDGLMAHPDFAVRSVEIVGATPDLARDVRRTIGTLEGRSSLSLDIDRLRAEIADLGAVAGVAVRLDPKGNLSIRLTRRRPVALWRDGTGRLMLVDATGARVREAGVRLAYPELPLLVGPGAERAVGEALALLESVPALHRRVRALARVGERRWDLILAPDLAVMLPEREPGEALLGAMGLHYAEALFDRDLEAVDLRVPERPVLRPRQRGTDQRLQGGLGTPGEDT